MNRALALVSVLRSLLISSLLLSSLLTGAVAFAETHAPNVLFLMVDDLRVELPVYGRNHIQAPNIERLAQSGTVFENAYANVPVCGASRASLMLGIRPAENRFVGYQARMDEDAPDAVPLFQYLKSQGYHTEALGKVMHFADDSVDGWSTTPWHPRLDNKIGSKGMGHRNYQLPENIKKFKNNRIAPAYEAADVADDAYYDGQIANRAIESLTRFSQTDQPFFLAVGFLKPHLPFNAPKAYWDLYNEDDIRLAENVRFPESVPLEARHNWGELRKYEGVPEAPALMPDNLARKLIHGYYASVSYTDAQIGKLLDALNQLQLEDGTIIFMLGDHGWSLGEHSLWAKHSPFDVATRTPLIIRIPGTKSGGHTAGLVEFIDIYPTLIDLIGLPELDQLQGQSLRPQLADVNAPGKDQVFPRWHRGEVIKTRNFALTEWFDKQGQVSARMLYDHRNDPDETTNVAEHPDYRLIAEDLHQRIVRMMAER